MLAMKVDTMAVITLHTLLEEHRREWRRTEEKPDLEAEENQIGPDEDVLGEFADDDIIVENKTNDVAYPRIEETSVLEGGVELIGLPLTNLAKKLASRCRLAWDMMPMTDQDKRRQYCVNNYVPATREANKPRVFEQLYGDWAEFGRDIAFGTILLELASTAKIIDRLELGNTRKGKKMCVVVRLIAAFLRAYTDVHRPLESFAAPCHRPMIVEPEPWTDGENGGYLYNGVACSPKVDPGTMRVGGA